MIQLDLAVPLTICHICGGDLIPHPLYEKSGTKYCPNDGDFFVQTLRDQKPTVYFDEFEIKDVPLDERDETTKRRRGHPGTVIRCDQTGITFPTIKSAVDALGIASASIFKHLKGERRSVGGYTFTRVLDANSEDFIIKPPELTEYAIVCNETGKIFTSIRHAADVMHVGRNAIRAYLSGKRAHVYGYTFSQRGGFRQ